MIKDISDDEYKVISNLFFRNKRWRIVCLTALRGRTILACVESFFAMQDFWQRLIDRAKELASKHSEAADLLSFYANLLGAQKRIYESLRNRQGWRPTGALAEDLSLLRLLLPGLLEVVAASGPAALAEQAGHLKQ